ncbi:DNA-binding CsgD family transcriptional regulator/predicted nucleic acid-binding protein [Thermocatellispora tengchongensis]|uniref:DNA-binding CsgD family transcriptional regulator/predicted nucleic acid-binding protein n=1 Tax=Thermocatellispora tengchongensis TaxID=1073253 RepID=A0A840PDD4_9ACTN|nr:LuxR family transcriptional regulator [Thermocatellispora tengchongensis]MBB5136736.1 DNA-binding CsgD family transcriptional regulator/predicted nucleic acid-binding protein [Thermocatellispora tengchongensis]
MRQEDVLGRWPLVGRAVQLDTFDEVLREPRSTGFLIFGPAGVGKSRLAEECAERAVRHGRRVGRAVATAAAASVPLGAIAHLLPAQVDLSDPVAGFAAVARLLSRPGSDSSATVLLIDDIHLLDATSAVLLRQLMDAGVAFLLGTVRSGGPPDTIVTALSGGDAVHQVDLAEFERPEVEILLERVLGGPVGSSTVSQLFTASGGNPLYLRELVAGAVASGALASDGELWEMTSGPLSGTRRLRDLIRSRLSAAPPSSRPVLDLLALCEPLSMARLAQEAAPSTLDRLEQEGLIVVGRERRRTVVRLAHPLYGEVRRADMTAVRRRETLLRHIALLRESGARRREDAIHLATCQLAATGTADTALLAQAAALATHAREYQRALSLLQAVPQDQYDVRLRLLLGKTLYEAGQFARAEAVLSEAQGLAREEPEVVSVAFLRIQNLSWGLGTSYRNLLDIIGDARRHVTTPLGRDVLQVAEAAGCFAVGEFARSIALLEPLRLRDGQRPDVMTWLVAVTTMSAALSFTGRGEEAVDWARRAIAVSEAVDAETYSMTTHEAAHASILSLALTESGRLREARSVSSLAHDTVVQENAGTEHKLLAFHLGRAAWLAGHPAQARRWYAELARASRPHTAILLPMALTGLAASAALQGDLEAAEAALAEHGRLTRPVPVPEEQLGHAWVLAAKGELSQARALLTAAAREAGDRRQLSFEAILLTDVARLGGARDVAERLAEIAEESGGHFYRVRARLAAAFAAQSPGDLLSVAEELETIGADLMAAEAAGTAAAILRRTGDPRAAQAADLRARSLAARCEGASTPALAIEATTAQLTRREREVALLASQGMPSKEIAAKLTVSVRTVDNHLRQVYMKLGIATRRELAARLRG